MSKRHFSEAFAGKRNEKIDRNKFPVNFLTDKPILYIMNTTIFIFRMMK